MSSSPGPVTGPTGPVLQPPPPTARRETPRRVGSGVGYWLRTVLLMSVVFITSVSAVGAAMARDEARGWGGVGGWLADAYLVVSVLVALLCPLLLLLRRRDLNNTAWGLGFLQILFPVGVVMAWVLPQAIRSHKRDEAEALSFLYVLGLVIWFLRDLLGGRTTETSLLRLVLSPPETPPTERVDLDLMTVSIAFVVLAVAPIAIGFYRRARAELQDTQAEATVQRAAAGEMSAQLSRQAERDLIAREVHDVIGHRLSLLTLHAGGLEVAASQDPELAESARYVRENAQRAMDDLRSLIAVLREPASAAQDAGALAPASMSLADLAKVIDDMAESGGPVASTVFLQQAEEADPVLSHSVYRIVQELLTNARKHAPEQLVKLRVSGGPATGVAIEASNPVPRGHAINPSGSGLNGIAERVEILGGTMEVPREDGRFSVRVLLPWSVTQDA
ncbi:sensor histidine kinase [Ornithinimicrobium panacihumi]|uniref:sensor histidine kinase n=1 Tax=Ornithinimicrobium panacihumi TaxID=2008449 RepID=UPI003F8B89EF